MTTMEQLNSIFQLVFDDNAIQTVQRWQQMTLMAGTRFRMLNLDPGC